MSIYSTLWRLRFPRHGYEHTGCEWVDVYAQGVPGFIGTPTLGYGYEAGDPYADFLPPAFVVHPTDDGSRLRAVVVVTSETHKGTARSGQEYVEPLLILTGDEYATITFDRLYARIRDALRAGRPAVTAEHFLPDGRVEVVFRDGTRTIITSGSRP